MPFKSKKKASSISAKLALMISDLSAALTLLIKHPLKHFRGVVRHEKLRVEKGFKRKKFTLLGLPMAIVVALLSGVAKILLAPLELWAAIFQKRKFPRSLSLVLVVGCCLLAGWAGYLWMSHRSQQAITSLRSQASLAVEQNSFVEAVAYFEQLEEAKATLSQEEKFRWAQALAQSNHSERANELLRELAPSPGRSAGYAPAHQFAAISLVKTQQQPYPTAVKQLLKWHLDSGGEAKSPAINFVLAQYLISVKQYPAAIEAMKLAAVAKPELNLILARLHNQVGDADGEQVALSLAQAEFESQLRVDSGAHQARIALAKIYLRQRKPDLAEQQLRAGFELVPEMFGPQLSAFFMQKFQSLPDTASVEVKIDSLVNCWQHDWQNVAAFQAAIQLYRQQQAKGSELVLAALQQAAVEQPSAAMPHFALGIIYRLENRMDESKAAIQVAHQSLNPQQPGFTAVVNNLAWLLAHDQQPDLDQAFKLAEMAVRQSPNQGRLRDTLATVLMKQGHYKKALVEFQKALPTIQNKSPVHSKMARIYDQLDQPELATLHRNRSQHD